MVSDYALPLSPLLRLNALAPDLRSQMRPLGLVGDTDGRLVHLVGQGVQAVAPDQRDRCLGERLRIGRRRQGGQIGSDVSLLVAGDHPAADHPAYR